jgi:hypothetical protein
MIDTEADVITFKYNLSACASAFRSTTHFMGKEYQHVQGFKSWYDGKFKSMNKGMQSFKGRRDAIIHQNYPRLSKDVTIHLGSPIMYAHAPRLFRSRDIPAAQTASQQIVKPKAEHKRFFVKGSNKNKPIRDSEDVITQVTRYIAELERWVTECETLFGK